MSKPQHYDRFMRAVHWLSAVAVIGLFAVGLWMVDLTYYSTWYRTAPYWHKSVGILLAALTITRLVWKSIKPMPAIEGSAFEKVAASIAHKLIYVLLFVIFGSGYLISTSDGRPIEVFNWFSVPALGELFENQSDIAGAVHYYAAFTLIALAVLHAVAAIKHHIINKDNTLMKMIGEKAS